MDNPPVSVSLVSFCTLLGIDERQERLWGGPPGPRPTPRRPAAIVKRAGPGGPAQTRGSALQQIRRAEEEPQLRLRGFRRVRTVYAVALDAGREPLADGALRGVGRVGGAHRLAPLADGVLALQRHHNDGPFGHELHQAREERLLAMPR